jgi:hypothetical protein
VVYDLTLLRCIIPSQVDVKISPLPGHLPLDTQIRAPIYKFLCIVFPFILILEITFLAGVQDGIWQHASALIPIVFMAFAFDGHV